MTHTPLRPYDSVRTIAHDPHHAAHVRRFWAPTTLRLPYPRMNVVALAEVIVSKHRNGPTGPVTLRFVAETMRFFDIDTGGHLRIA